MNNTYYVRMSERDPSIKVLPVYLAADFCVTDGVAEGDQLGTADECVMDDIYQIVANAQPRNLKIDIRGGSPFVICKGSETGQPGRDVHLDCCLTLMADDGTTYEALVLVEVDGNEAIETYLLPLARLAVATDYRLVRADRGTATTRFADVSYASFARGTHIALATGQQVPIEQLQVGDKVLTRDDGAQEVRWIRHSTFRAVGDFAPVVIRAGALFNTRDLVLSPDHRVFVYQRRDQLGAGRAEILVKARHLVNGDSVVQRDGGFIDYFQLLFDDHQIVYAEGIAAETMLVDHQSRVALPDEMRDQFEHIPNGHSDRAHLSYEVTETLFSEEDAVALLRRAAAG